VRCIVYAPLRFRAPFCNIHTVADIESDNVFVAIPLYSVPQFCIRLAGFFIKQELTDALNIHFFVGSFAYISPSPETLFPVLIIN
jgi:hypothetical protein